MPQSGATCGRKLERGADGTPGTVLLGHCRPHWDAGRQDSVWVPQVAKHLLEASLIKSVDEELRMRGVSATEGTGLGAQVEVQSLDLDHRRQVGQCTGARFLHGQALFWDP